MNPIRFQLIRARAAQILRLGHPMLTPETQLLADVRMLTSPAPTEAEFTHVLLRMEHLGQILRVRNDDEGVKVKLTELGEAEFPET